ncbi:DUF5691 domain-containing protein [Kibdelosporangium phytohabitans]|uniref:Uncharacterized protein n=1 Tax=Kibdelosporangium phytohabitans TaxID=860235 RepID=A0A0N9HRH8_9PSEU|nr:DUF5691 domain-containing protein [Kibdelosporangium phytohabitans]ALG05641.1 hypothetical protein AOZ06_00700 [Kibdelosporangium phytohabitans]MBE1466383.1 hypothetical protein [Kibdelosporangium phytohabitans]
MSWPEITQKVVIGSAEPERTLADCAAYGLARRGSRIAPEANAEPIPPAPEDNRAEASARVGAIFSQVMATEDNEMLRECCLALDRANLVVPYRQLPDILAAATARSVVRDAVLPALGSRGRWLAQRRAGWAWAAGQEDLDGPIDIEDALDLSPVQRKARLVAARRQDPARFRAYIAEHWPELRRVEDRKLLIAALAEGLSADDEPILEQALDDRSTNVREEAVALLRRLPGSALSKRAEQRLRDGLLEDTVDLHPDGPYEQEPDRDELRDSPVRRTGSARLKADSASVSPDFWLDWLGPKAPRRLRLSTWGTALLQGVAENLGAANDPVPWLTDLASTISSTALLDALDKLPSPTLARVLIKLAGSWDANELDYFCGLLPSPWHPDVTRVVLERFAELADRGWRVGRPPEALLRRGDLRVLHDHWPRIAARWPVHGAEELVLRLRTELHEEIERSGNP